MRKAEGQLDRAQGLRERGNSKPPHPVSNQCRELCRPHSLQPGDKLFPVHPPAASQGRGISSEQSFSQINQGVQHPAVCPSMLSPVSHSIMAWLLLLHLPRQVRFFWAIKAPRAGQEFSFGEQRPACLSESDNRAVKFHLLYSAGSLQHTGVPTDCQAVCSHTTLAVLAAGSHLSLRAPASL